MKKYIVALTSIVRLIYLKHILRLDINFHPLQSHSIFSCITLTRAAKLSLAKNTQLSAGCEIFIAKEARVEIGIRTYFNKRCIVSAHNEVVIGENCLFGPDVKIYDNNHVIKPNAGVVHGKHNSKPVHIGNNCWLAANVIVLAGTSIGDNCVIGAGTIVKGNIPANSIVKANITNNIVPIQ